MLIAERNGIRRFFKRSNRSNTSTDFRDIFSTFQEGTLIPALPAKRRARASHNTTFVSSVLCGNFAINRSPSLFRTEAFGRAPPSDDPGASSKRKSSSVSASPSKCSAAVSSRGNSTSGGIRHAASGRRNGPPGSFENRSAPCRASSSTINR